MESPSPAPSPMNGSMSASAPSTSSRGVRDDISSLTSFNPFSDEDEHDQSSYNLVTSFLSKMKSISAPLSSAVASTSSNNPSTAGYAASSTAPSTSGGLETRRPSMTATATTTSNISTSTKNSAEKPHSFLTVPSRAAPPVVDTSHLLPMGSFSLGIDEQVAQGHSSRQSGPVPGVPYSPVPFESLDSGVFGTSIPGFPIPDDTRSIKTSTSFQRSNSVSKVMRKIRGEGLSKEYWMDDENAKECYDCKSVFTAWRRKHHCRICGQIFCSRCASNIINGGRFGHNGQIRVCNLCLEKLAAVDDDEDDRRSIISSFTDHALRHSFTPGRFPPPSPFGPVGYHPGHGHYVAGYGSEGADSRPVSPHFAQGPNGEVQGLPAVDKIAPFRRPMSEEDAYASGLFQEDAGSVSVAKQANGVDIPSRKLSIDVSVSSIQFPIGSPDQESPMPSRFTSHPLYGEYDVGTPFIRSRVHSRLDSIHGEPSYRVRRESTVYMAELNTASMNHLAIMLRQMLTTEGIPNVKDWEGVLLKMALRIAKEMTFISLPHRQGQDMDVRRYVKIKKIPGGTPKDSEYVNGAVITKNVAHKQMARNIPNPRVMLVTFPLEFHRVEGQYMHFGQIVRQEKEYLTNLASRIAALRPHVVLVEKSVSRIALDALTKNNIAVARSVKPAAVQTVARMTQGDLFSSMDKLALEPRLGHCARFRIQTFDHHLIPGQRKTYMRFEGCTPDMGCTILLRGGDIQTLRRIKKVMRFLTFIVRNLKLETHLWKDTYITLGASLGPEATPHGHSRHSSEHSSHLGSGLGLLTPASTSLPFLATPIMARPPAAESSSSIASITVVDDLDEEGSKGVRDEDAQQALLSKRIEESLEPYKTTFIAVSATLRFPPPYPIQKMKDLDDELVAAKRSWEDEVIRSEERLQARKSLEAQQQALPTLTVTNVKELEQQQQEVESLEQGDISAQIAALPSTLLSPTPSGMESLTPYGPSTLSPAAMQEGESYFSLMNPILSPLSSLHFDGLVVDPAAAVHQEKKETLKTVEDLELQSRYSLVKWKHEEHRRIWEWYLRKNKDDFVVEKYQNISLRHFVVPINGLDTARPCKLPTLQYITFYGENDLTLGQFIEKSASETLAQFLDPKAICEAKDCDQPLARHGKAFVHNETRVFVEVEQWDSQTPKMHSLLMSYPGAITTWTKCRLCGLQTPYGIISQELQRYSFSKFLEAYFYPPDVHLMREAGCQHNIYRHHYRFFSAKGMTIRFQADHVDLQELVFPPFRIRVRPETQLKIKNHEFNQLHVRNERWYDGLVHDLHEYAMDATTGEEEADQKLRQDINVLLVKAETERRDVVQLINKIYRESAATDTLALNQVHAYRQDRIVAWQQDFDKLAKLKGGEKTIGKRTTTFGSVRAMWKYDFQGPFTDSFYSAQSEAEDGSTKSRRATGESTFSTSDVSESEKESVPESASTATTISSATLTDLGSWPADPATSATEADKLDEVGEQGPNTPLPTTPAASAPIQEDPKPEPPIQTEPEPPEPAMPLIPVIETGPSDAEKDDSEAPDPDPESDSTIGIGARPRRKVPESQRKPRRVNFQFDDSKMPSFNLGPPNHRSRTAKKGSNSGSASNQPKVAELVRKYSDSLPPQTVQELVKSAMGPTPMSESEQEYPSNIPRRTPQRTRNRHSIARKNSTSDFEQGYAANVAPRLPRRTRKALGVETPVESRTSSRQVSPEKRTSFPRHRGLEGSRPSSPTRRPPGSQRPSKLRLPSLNKETKIPSRPSSAGPTKTTFNKSRLPGPTLGKVSNLAKHYDRLGKEMERAKTSKYTVLRGKKARPVASARAKVEILESINDLSDGTDPSDADDESEGEDLPKPPANALEPPSDDEKPIEKPPDPETPKPAMPPDETTPPPTSTTTGEEAVPDAGQELLVPPAQEPTAFPPSPFLEPAKPSNEPLTPPYHSDNESVLKPEPSILQTISKMWKQNTSGWDDLGDPEHIFRDADMVVRLDEPTSIIALALNSPQYREMLAKSRADKRTAKGESSLFEGTEAFMPDDGSVAESTSTWGMVNIDAADTIDPNEDPRSFSSRLPWAITFESGGLTLSCTVLYPEQFDAIRKMFDCEKSIVESLSRCVKWNASGGKSGSAFLKTQDDRFIAKELSRAELQTMETFAPAYFDYMSSAVSANRPTLLAKVFGCYKLTIKRKDRQPGKARSTQMNLLVMENLFYDRSFSRIYDLKGSTRNRHVQSTGNPNEVLLDENLVEAAHTHPFYLREHSKRILRGALYNDSRFLAEINVMDYSLVCGVDSDNNELVLGIVDYIRTYTWDKKLETWVKETAFLGGGGKGEPTIVTPRQYRQRFLGAMERYFPLVPDRWMKHKDAPEEEASTALSELWRDW